MCPQWTPGDFTVSGGHYGQQSKLDSRVAGVHLALDAFPAGRDQADRDGTPPERSTVAAIAVPAAARG
jgi:hypothetical protein